MYLIFIIISSSKTAVIEPYFSLEDSARLVDHLVFTSLDFTIVFVLQSKVVSLEDQFSVFTLPRNRVALLYPQAWSSLIVAFCDSQGYGGSILTCLHIEKFMYM